MSATGGGRPTGATGIGWGDPVDRVKGIGPRLREALEGEGLGRLADLLLHLPRRYEDRTTTVTLDAAAANAGPVLVRARLRGVTSRRGWGRATAITRALAVDGSGSMPVVWFNQPWIASRLPDREEVLLYGRVGRGRSGTAELVNPEVDEVSAADTGPRLVPVYPQAGPLQGRRLRRIMERCTDLLDLLDDPLPPDVRAGLEVPALPDALRMLHRPWEATAGQSVDVQQRLEELNRWESSAHRTLAMDELLTLCCVVERSRASRQRQKGSPCALDGDVRALADGLFPFQLTAAQQRAASEIAADMAGHRPMARLLQGDVGAGKTAVAILAMRLAAEAGRQAALMAPTEILAEQHLGALRPVFEGIGWTVEPLSGSMPPGRRREVRKGLASGAIRLVVGTHALLQETVGFRDLGLVVVDEQHRFGVAQRQALLSKGAAPHLLVMTATPIPRSLALTLYGDMDVSTLDELPPGRTPVTTVIRRPEDTERLFGFLGQEVRQGGRAYVVFPLIDESPDVDAASLSEHGDRIRSRLAGVRVAVLHGQLAAEERQRATAAFRDGTVQVLLATSLVEVGVDVPEATLMIVASPERFGLSQLHQLRGRVGRGRRRSWCVLLADPARLTEDQRRRLEVFCSTRDGFAIAEADLRLRGAGEVTGLRQWGEGELRLADLVLHADLVPLARRTARRLRDTGRLDPVLERLSVLHPLMGEVRAG